MLSKHHGFTLLEMLVALTLLALLLTVTFTSFVSINHSVKQIEKISVDNYRFFTVSRFVMNKIASAHPVDWVSEGLEWTSDQRHQFIKGDHQSMTWLGVMSPTQDLGGIHFMRILQADNERLVFQWLPFDVSKPDWRRAKEYTLLSSVSLFRIEYFDAKEAEWVSDWGVRPGLPRFVRLYITTPKEDWSHITVQLMHWAPL